MSEAVIIGVYTLEPMANILGEWVCVSSPTSKRGTFGTLFMNEMVTRANGIFFLKKNSTKKIHQI